MELRLKVAGIAASQNYRKEAMSAAGIPLNEKVVILDVESIHLSRDVVSHMTKLISAYRDRKLQTKLRQRWRYQGLAEAISHSAADDEK